MVVARGSIYCHIDSIPLAFDSIVTLKGVEARGVPLVIADYERDRHGAMIRTGDTHQHSNR